jgi:hypothetical protein
MADYHVPLTEAERDELCRLFHLATGEPLLLPPVDRPDAWQSEFMAACGPPLRALEQAASQRRDHQRR